MDKFTQSKLNAISNNTCTTSTLLSEAITLLQRIEGNKNYSSILNSSESTVAASTTWVGKAEEVSEYNSVTTSLKSTQNATLSIEFSSTGGAPWVSLREYNVKANTNEVHRLTVSRGFVRVSVENETLSDAVISLETLIGSQPDLVVPANAQVQRDVDARVVRPLDFNLMVAEGLYEDIVPVFKEGVMPSTNAGSNLSLDITNMGTGNISGIYMGFPLGVGAAAEIVVVGADTGTVVYNYLETPTSLDYQTASIAVAGAGTYPLPHNVWRSNFSFFTNPGQTKNVSNIYMRHTATPTNIFWWINQNVGQSQCAAYTVPYKSRMYIDRFTGNMRGAAAGSVDGNIWWREYGMSPRDRFEFELQFGTLYFDDVDYLVPIPERTDFIPRVTYISNNNTIAKYTIRFLKAKQAV